MANNFVFSLCCVFKSLIKNLMINDASDMNSNVVFQKLVMCIRRITIWLEHSLLYPQKGCGTLEKMMLESLISTLTFFAYLQPFMVISYPYSDFFIKTLTVKATLHDSHLRRQTCEQGYGHGSTLQNRNTLGGRVKEDLEFKASLNYIVWWRPAWAMWNSGLRK